jgi:putative transcriptional regulator
MDELSSRIAGEITLSQNPGASLKKWREIFGITQIELAEHLKVSPSTISDYEGNRRKSPGINIIKRFINAIVELDNKKGGWTVKKLQLPEKTDVYQLFEFPEPIKSVNFVKKIEGKIVTNEDVLKESKIYGYTIIDALRAILELPADEFIKIYGSTTERALIFTNISMGRSPLIAIRVTKLKPTMVVLHNIQEIDKLAIKISELERIPLITTLLPIDEIKKKAQEPEK